MTSETFLTVPLTREVNMLFFNSKNNLPITAISFDGTTRAVLTASNATNADFVRRVLRTLVLTSGTDGEKVLDVSLEKTQKDLNITITGEDILSVLKTLSNTKPPTFNKASIKKTKLMCQSHPCKPPNVKMDKIPSAS